MSTPSAEQSASAPAVIERNRFEDEFPVMFKFYWERGRLTDAQMQKVHEIQQRWKSGFVFWLTHDNQEIEIPEWVAVNVVVNNKQNLVRGSRICMSLNHTKGYGCNRLADGMCTYVHECALCGQVDHGVFQKRGNGIYICTRLRKWYDEESRYKQGGFGDPRKHEDRLTDLAKQPRVVARPARRNSNTASVWDSPASSAPTGARPAAPSLELPEAAVTKSTSAVTAVSELADDDAPTTHAGSSSQQSVSTCSSQRSPEISSQPPPRSDPPTEPPPPRLPPDWKALWCEEHQAYYFWHVPTSKTTWDLPTLDESSTKVGGTNGDTAAKKKSSKQGNAKVCNQHWQPPPDTESCIRVLKGESLVVTWTEGKPTGWAYGHLTANPNQAGYFPQAVLIEPTRAPQKRSAGEVCEALEAFEPPEEVGGYLTVEPGEALRLLHPTEATSAWAYAEKVARPDGTQNRRSGWVPESVLSCRKDADKKKDDVSRAAPPTL